MPQKDDKGTSKSRPAHAPMTDLRLKRAYVAATPDDGLRVLVDRLWPRGVKKADAAIDLWLRDIAPSTELRKWFGHRPDRWEAFRAKYRAELADNPAVERLTALGTRRVTLVYAAKDEDYNQARVLREYLQSGAGA
jgi:uncharacterized protein YeaO (DUF488 family)